MIGSSALLFGLAAYTPGSVLDHPTRRRIYEHLLVLPGDHFRSIVRCLRLGLGTVRHHLEVLMSRGLVRVEKMNGRARYFPTGQGADPHLNMLFEQHWTYRDLRLRILFAVRRMHQARAVTLARMLEISRQLAAYHLARLEEAGYVKCVNGLYSA